MQTQSSIIPDFKATICIVGGSVLRPQFSHFATRALRVKATRTTPNMGVGGARRRQLEVVLFIQVLGGIKRFASG